MKLRVLVAATAAALAVPWIPASAAGTIPLPLPPPPPTALLGTGEPGEQPRAPGPVSDSETVHVALGEAGGLAAITVDQTLVLQGAGDFFLHIPGPALDVRSLDDQAVEPGLHRGAIIWQGFSSGKRTLRARATLDPVLEQSRLPFEFSIKVTSRGRPVKPPFNGPVEITMRVRNTTGRPQELIGGDPARGPLGALLDRLRADILAGRRPLAGRSGVPSSLPGAIGPTTQELIQAPLFLAGRLYFDGGSIDQLRIAGGTLQAGSDVPIVHFGRGSLLGTMEVSVFGVANGLGAPKISSTVHAGLPPASRLAPGGWAARLARASKAELRAALLIAERTLAETSRATELDAYLGNPGFGPARTSFVVRTRTTPAPGPKPPKAEHLRPMGLALVSLALAGVLGNAALLWRRN